MRALKTISSVIVTLVALVALWGVVVQPYLANARIQGAALQLRNDAGVHHLRMTLATLRRDVGDPYLAGRQELLRARVLSRLGRVGEAKEAYTRAVAMRVGPEVKVEAAVAYLRTGDTQGARELLESVSRFSPELIGPDLDRAFQQERP